MASIELSTRRRVTRLTSDEFTRLFVSLQRRVDGEAAYWSTTDVESWELVGSPVIAGQHLTNMFAAASEFAATLADRLYHTTMPVTEESVITAYADDLVFWASHPDLDGVPCALWNIVVLQAAEWAHKEAGIVCELDVHEPLV